jgi:hypothetical protein
MMYDGKFVAVPNASAKQVKPVYQFISYSGNSEVDCYLI